MKTAILITLYVTYKALCLPFDAVDGAIRGAHVMAKRDVMQAIEMVNLIKEEAAKEAPVENTTNKEDENK